MMQAGMEKLQQNLSEIHQLSHQRAELQAKKAEIMIKEQTARPTGEMLDGVGAFIISPVF